ncbi:thiopurine S-methyltransferase [Microbulbifer thermotolerans]|uniref:thiopurine S-methyltransferase n=1 Tax=Microbulbifer thermotolerans TaxID=252514 RepID=UPI0008ED1C08|nr:thiopurine S-methyltransferase [Microbulbifer thermotolerans]MCX2794346.1 thiopurine S-methyltransferase [Microbulbifer thermotolerans]SFC58591.1 thiopurine S-methyltransferase [Microbulbifer thermotolerans]
MEAGFWHKRWAKNEIAFHEGKPNALLVKHVSALSIAQGKRFFVPLCGKTQDIPWLLARGYQVVGAELSRIAVEQLFAEAGVEPEITSAGGLTRYSAEAVDLFVGDIFNLTAEQLGPVDAIYDRAALVALPEPMRRRYSAHLQAITGGVPQLLITFEYDQRLVAGPPFSVGGEEIAGHYGESYQLTKLESVPFPGRLKNKCEADETIWLLEPKQ